MDGSSRTSAYVSTEGGAEVVKRDIITTGTVRMTVDDPKKTSGQIVDLVEELGGRIDAQTSHRNDDGSNATASLTLRIPSGDVTKVLTALEDLGVVENVEVQSEDVTGETVDLDARIKTLRTSIHRLNGWLNEAGSVSDLVRLENTLSNRQTDLERLTGQRKVLGDQISYSTIDVKLSTEPVVDVVVDTSPKDFFAGVAAGWATFTKAVGKGLIVLGVLLPWLLFFAIVAIAIIAIVRVTRRRMAPTAGAAPTDTGESADPSEASTPSEPATSASPGSPTSPAGSTKG